MSDTPRHIAIIPDGNRRWAKANKKKAVWLGHEQGAVQFKQIMQSAFESGVEFLTFWTTSESNLTKRPKAEVDFLVKLLSNELKQITESEDIDRLQVHVRIIGRGEDIVKNKTLSERIVHIEEKTRKYTKHTLTILFGYDGQQEMLAAIEQLRGKAGGVTGEALHAALWTRYLPPVDLVIRTGGEPHWSAGFMMWLTADSQFYFTEKLWPDFNQADLAEAINDFSQRERRMGK